MTAQTIFTVLVIVLVFVWLIELIWLFKITEDQRGDPIRVVSGSAIFFVFALPVAMLAPGLVDGIGGLLESIQNALFGKGGGAASQGDQQTPARLLIDGQETPLMLPRTRLGRYPNNEIVIDNSTVSAYHAEIIRRPDSRHEIVDRESRNGTRVNGSLIRSQILKDGDLITLGGATLHYLSSAEATVPVADEYPPERQAMPPTEDQPQQYPQER